MSKNSFPPLVKPRYRRPAKRWLQPVLWAVLLTVCVGYMAASESPLAQEQYVEHTTPAKRSVSMPRYRCVNGKLASVPASACGKVIMQ